MSLTLLEQAARHLADGRSTEAVASFLVRSGAQPEVAAQIMRELGDRPRTERGRFRTTLVFPVYHAEIILTHVSEERGEVRSNIEVRTHDRRCFSDSRANLSSMRDRRDLVQILTTREPSVPWEALVDHMAAVAHDDARRMGLTEPVDSVDLPVSLPKAPLLPPYIVDGHPTLLVAEPEVGKSTLALAIAMEIAGMDGTAPWRCARTMPVLYLDFEYGQEEWTDSVGALLHGRPRKRGLYYMHGGKPLRFLADEIARQIDTLGIGYLVIDAITGAAGDLIDANSINRFAETIRALGVGSLWIAHVDKATMRDTDRNRNGDGLWSPPGRTHPYGGALWLGHVRSKIVLHEDGNFAGTNQPPGEKRLVLTHEKNQKGRWQKPLGLTLDFRGGISIVSTGPWTATRASAPASIRSNRDILMKVLADGEMHQERELRDRTDIGSPAVLATALRELGAISDGITGWRLPMTLLDDTVWPAPVAATADDDGSILFPPTGG